MRAKFTINRARSCLWISNVTSTMNTILIRMCQYHQNAQKSMPEHFFKQAQTKTIVKAILVKHIFFLLDLILFGPGKCVAWAGWGFIPRVANQESTSVKASAKHSIKHASSPFPTPLLPVSTPWGCPFIQIIHLTGHVFDKYQTILHLQQKQRCPALLLTKPRSRFNTHFWLHPTPISCKVCCSLSCGSCSCTTNQEAPPKRKGYWIRLVTLYIGVPSLIEMVPNAVNCTLDSPVVK